MSTGDQHAEGEDAVNGVASNRVVSSTLVGRSEELDVLMAAVRAPPAVMVVEGQAGVGKTRLVSELTATLRRSGMITLVGGCRRIREPFPLGPIVEAMRGLGNRLAHVDYSPVAGALRPLLPEFAPLLPPAPPPLDDRIARQHRLFRAIVEMLNAASPAVLVLEDLHWADELTADFLSYALGGDTLSGLALVVTLRDDEVDPSVRSVVSAVGAPVSHTRLALAPLGQRDTGALAAAILGTDHVPDELSRQLWQWTSGLPFAVEELLALLRARGDLLLDSHNGTVQWAFRDLEVPAGVRDHVWQRVRTLSSDARSVVEAAGVLRVPVPVPVVVATCSLPDAATRQGLEEALTVGVLVDTDGGVGFRHLLAAQAVYEAIPVPRRRELHGRAASATAALADPPLGQVAHHLRYAGQSEAWVDAAERAADQALALGHDAEAERLLEDVLRHTALDQQRQGHLAIKLGAAAAQSLHSTPKIISVLRGVLQRMPPGRLRGELRFRLAVLLNCAATDIDPQRQLLADAVVELDERPDLRAHAMIALGIPAPGVSLAERWRWLYRAMEILPQLPDPETQNLLLGKIAMVLVSTGDPLWRYLTDIVRQRTRGVPRRRWEVIGYMSIAENACRAGHLQATEQLLTAALTAARADESRELELRVRARLALLDYSRGAWEGLTEAAVTLGDQLCDYGIARLDVEVVTGCLALAQGDLVDAQRRLERVVQQLERAGSYDLLAFPVSALARVPGALAAGGAAVTTVQRFLSLTESVALHATAVRALPAVVGVLVGAGRQTHAREVVSHYERQLHGLDAPLSPAALSHAQGLLEAAAGRWEPAARLFAAAVRGYDGLPYPYEAAHAREQRALAQFSAGSGGQAAADTLRAALVSYGKLGATWDFSRAARAARQRGVVVPVRHRGGRHSYGSELSPREREVAALAAAGRTNREIGAELFISLNTVKRQLSGAMRKLGVRTRAEVSAQLVTEHYKLPER